MRSDETRRKISESHKRKWAEKGTVKCPCGFIRASCPLHATDEDREILLQEAWKLVDVRVATHVKVSDKIEKIVSKQGIGPHGEFLKGGFSVTTKGGNIVSMWEAQAYLKKTRIRNLKPRRV